MKTKTSPQSKEKRKTAYSYIRFSSPKQMEGDSLLRQLKRTEDYARKQNLVLDKETRLRDLGISGYTGANLRKEKALGGFLEAVKEGKIERGTVLICEELDRLSREKPLRAFRMFSDILEAGVEIVTLQDGIRYTWESVNKDSSQLFISIGKMIGAHDFALRLSDRIGEAWKRKKLNARETHSNKKAKKKVKITARCPAWLRLNKKTGKFEEFVTAKENRPAIVRRIFALAAGGVPKTAGKQNYKDQKDKPLGRRSIAAQLNHDKVPPFGSSRFWVDSYIQKILRNRAVLGEYQPYKRTEDGRVKDGELPINNYYPKVVDFDLFQKAQGSSNNTPGAIGETCSNLFTRIIFDGDNSTDAHKVGMVFANKAMRNQKIGTRYNGRDTTGKFTKGKKSREQLKEPDWKYLVSKAKTENKSLPTVSWKYSWFEELFLSYIKTDWSKVVLRKSVGQTKEVDKEIGDVINKQAEVASALEQFKYLARKPNPPEELLEWIREEEKKKAELAAKRGKLEDARRNLFSVVESKKELDKLLSDKSDKASLLATRLRLRGEIQRQIAAMFLFSAGGKPAFFQVVFKNGARQVVVPAQGGSAGFLQNLEELGGRPDKTVYGKSLEGEHEIPLAYVFNLREGEDMASRFARTKGNKYDV